MQNVQIQIYVNDIHEWVTHLLQALILSTKPSHAMQSDNFPTMHII